MTDRSREFYRLETVAALVRLPPARIRRYVRIGLVRPARVAGRTAMFGDDELARLRKISRLGEHLGLNDAGIEVVLRLLDEIERLHQAGGIRPDAPDGRD